MFALCDVTNAHDGEADPLTVNLKNASPAWQNFCAPGMTP